MHYQFNMTKFCVLGGVHPGLIADYDPFYADFVALLVTTL